MKYLSVCAGIEAASVAWHPLGWKAAGYSEIEPFPSAVLKHHYPDVTNFGDMTKFKEWNLDSIDLLVGGTPCQSFSVAGLRKGLADPRGNLALVYCGILDHFRPKWFVWENVPGVLSSNGGRDFGSFLGALAELGYGFAYRVLDAQYFGVAQRRRRVFVVGYLGDWRPAAKVLFERESMRGDSAPSREKRQEVATDFIPSIAGSLDTECGGGKLTHQSVTNGHLIGTITARMVAFGEYVNDDTASTIKQRDYKDATDLVSYGIPGNWIGRSPENGGNAVEPMYDISPCLTKMDRHGVAQPIAFEPGKLKRLGYGYAKPGLAPTLRSDAGDNQLAVAQPIYMGNAEGGAKEVPFLTCHNLGGTAGISNQTPLIGQPITFSGQMSVPQTDVDMSATLQAKNPMAVAQPIASADVTGALTVGHHSCAGHQHRQGDHSFLAMQSMAVRRLTPVECERLQGFPDNYTNIPWRKAAESPDGPRYKALGNSMAVPVMAWIGQRIANSGF